MKLRYVLLAVLLLAFSLGIPVSFAQEANLAEACVESYDPDVDYFPDKVAIDYADGLKVEYFNNYKVVSVINPWPGATETDAFQYVLVQCGTPAPEGYDSAQMTDVPVGDMIALSTTYLPPLVELGLLDHLTGLDSFLYASTPEVREKIDAGELIEVGGGAAINVEMVLDANPSMVMTGSGGAPEYDAHPVLLDAGVFVAMNGDWLEQSPLGRAEWLKYVAVFYNHEAEANVLFDGIVSEYNDLAALTADISEDEKPLVLWNSYSSYSEAWDIPGQASYIGQLLHDAGVHYVLSDDEAVQNSVYAPFSFEAVYDAGGEADIWFANAFLWKSLDDAQAEDERYTDFAPFQSGETYNNNARENVNGFNDYFESGSMNPQVILADIIRIVYPDLLPDHDLVYFQKLAAAT